MMIRISALNDSSDDESQSQSKGRQTTKEAQEAAALTLYNRALTLLRQGDEEGAKDTFCQLLEAPFVRDAQPPEGKEVLVEPGLVLKYSTYKNLGSMTAQKEDFNTAMKYYLEAVMVDSSDVTVWYKIGSIALKLHHFPLARHAFEQGLECQPRHWPCIDNVITVLYALNNYEACLVYISRALQRDPGYVKGICFMEKIFDEQPTLRRHMIYHFANCDQSIFTVEVDQEEADEFIDEALDMRAKKELLCRRRERPVLKFTQSLTAFTWMNLGTCLISLYDHIASSKPPVTYSCKVDLSAYTSKESMRTLANIHTTTTKEQPPQPLPSTEKSPAKEVTTDEQTEKLPIAEEVAAKPAPNEDTAHPTTAEQVSVDERVAGEDNVNVPDTESMPVTPAASEPSEPSNPAPKVEASDISEAPCKAEEGEQAMEAAVSEEADPGQSANDVSMSSVEQVSDAPTTTDDAQTSEVGPAIEAGTSGVEVTTVPGTAGSSNETATELDVTEKEEGENAADASVVMDANSQSQGDISTSVLDASSIREPGKRGPKRKRFMADTEKRRSARVRNTGSSKQIEDDVKLRDLVVSLLPTALTEVRDEDLEAESSQEAAMETGTQEDKAAGPADGETGDRPEVPLLSATEEEDVENFMKTHQINSGIIDLLNEFLITLGQRALSIWPAGLTAVYVKAYTRLHKHIILPGYLCKDVSDERLKNMGKMILVHSELKVDNWISTRSRATTSPRRSGSNPLGANFAGQSFYSDVAYLDGLSQCQDIFGDEWADFSIRVFWMKAKFNVLDNDKEEAIFSFDMITSYLEYLEKEKELSIVYLPHLNHDSKITQETVKQQMESLERCQSQDKMQDLHDSGEYEKVIQLLLETFSHNTEGSQVLEMEHQERHTQLLLLMESLLKVKDYKRGMIWGEVSFNQAIQKYYNAPNDTTRDEWMTAMTQIMDTIDKCMDEDKSVISSLSSKCLVRLTQNLISLIEMAFDVPENASDMAFSTMLPWILLYKLVRHEEDLQAPTPGPDESFTFVHRGSINLLELVHEQLGRRAWCCTLDGSLLLFIVNQVLAEIKAAKQRGTNHPQHKAFDLMLEQCFYCLYGHPNRKKAKHLQDHSSSQISLTWERAVHVFEFFKPKTMPEYDSLKTSTVSGELESLLRRIYIMIPADLKLPITVEEITTYIEGTSDTPPAMPDGTHNELLVMSELYYLLADFYFKNKEQGKAIKFYMQDLCVNPTRFDSWAGMALARASRLEQKLSMSELKSEGKNEGSIWKYAVASLRSFQRALDIDDTNSKLWIEYGALAYQLHAHASRQLKQLRGDGIIKKQSIYPLSEQSIEEAKSNRTDMLNIAGNCYSKAGQCEADENEEEWLHHYMLGKVAEKKASNPREYLQHYKLALHHLHNDRARYPRKITYIYSPPRLAVETLEVFYRLHASIMKYLLAHPDDAPYAMFDTYTQEAADGPFANSREKGKEPKEREANADDSSNSNLTAPSTSGSGGASTNIASPTNPSGKKKCHSLRTDHTYSKQRSIDSARSDADSSNDTAKDGVDVSAKVTSVVTITSDSMDSLQSPIAIVTTASTIPASATYISGTVEEVRFVAPVSTSVYNQSLEAGKLETPLPAPISGGQRSGMPLASSSFTSAASDEAKCVPESESSPKPSTSTQAEVPVSTSDKKDNEAEAISPDTTCVDEMDVVMEQEGNMSMDTSVSDVQPSTSVEILSPNTPQSLSQESLQAKEEPFSRTEDTAMNAVSSCLSPEDCTIKDDSKVKEPTSLEDKGTAEYYEDDASVKVKSEASSSVKMEVEEAAASVSTLDVGIGHAATDSSSQDSTTAAELERLKSEISFLNEGSSAMDSAVYIDSSDQESVKDGKESLEQAPIADVKIEPEEENKEDEDLTSRNEALEALKSELQELSAAAGSEMTPSYDDQLIKVEAGSLESSSQGFSQSASETIPKSQSENKDEAEKPDEASMDVSGETKNNEEVETKDDVSEPQLEVSKQQEHVETKEQDLNQEVTSLREQEIKQKQGTQDESAPAADNRTIDGKTDKESTPKDSGFAQLKPAGSSSPHVVEEGENEENANIENHEKKQSEVGAKSPSVKEKDDTKSSDKDLSEKEETKSADKDPLEKGKEGENKSPEKESPSSSKDMIYSVKETKATDTETKKETETTKGTESVEIDKEVKDGNKGASEKILNPKEMFIKIMTKCMKALSLCLSRFPHHYKSLYRLAYLYKNCEDFKNPELARDLLLGNMNWTQLDHMSSPGLFQDRKSTNFFQGLWRIPVEEIDRSGSFACHMLRSLQLLFPVLTELNDSKMLFSIHLMLSRIPDQGRKYLRDSDRLELSRLALVYCIEILDTAVKEKAELKDRDLRVAFMLEIFKVWQHCVAKSNQLTHSHTLNKLLRRAYFTCMKEQVEDEPSVLEQAIRFCQHEQQQAVKSPTTPEPSSRASLPGTPTTKRGNPLEAFSLPPRIGSIQAESYKMPHSEISASKSQPLKGVTPLSASVSSPVSAKAISKVVKPCSVRLTSPMRPKSSPVTSGSSLKSSPVISGTSTKTPPAAIGASAKSSLAASIQKAQKLHEAHAKKLTIGNVLKKPDIKKTVASSSGTPAASTSSTSSQKGQKKTSSPYSIFQSGGAGVAGLSSTHAAALYAQMAQMAQMTPEALLAQYGAAYSQEAIMQQMALASTYGIPMAAMPYLYPGTGMDPALWSSLAAAQVFQEPQQSTKKATPPPRQSSTVKSSSGSTPAGTPSAGQQLKASQKLQRSTPTSAALEPPKKVPKMAPTAWSPAQKTSGAGVASQSVSSYKHGDQPLALTKQDKPLSLTTKTTVSASTTGGGDSVHFPAPAHKMPTKVSSQVKSQPGMRLSAKTSQLYAVRMSSALAKVTQQKAGPAPDAPPPAKVAKKAETSVTSVSTGGLDSLNMLATVAQTYKLSGSAVTAKPPAVKPEPAKGASSPRPQPSVTAEPRTIKGPPTLKRAGKFHHHVKQAVHRAVPAHGPTSPRSASATAFPAHPLNLASQPAKGLPLVATEKKVAGMQKGIQSMPKSVQGLPKPAQSDWPSLLQHHLTSQMASPSSTVVTTARAGTAVQTKPNTTTSKTVFPMARPSTAGSQGTGPRPPSQLPAPPRFASSVQPQIRSRAPTQASSVPQGYGRGKPSYPATLASRPQNDDSSDDCIVISSGQDSESD